MSAAQINMTASLRGRILANLARFERRSNPDGDLTPAAVTLVLVGDAQGRACFVITRRASDLRNHAGQWALPGGRMEPGETPVDAALRETHEEIGLELETSSVVGMLDDYPTRSGFVITPIVVWGGTDPPLVPDPREVAEIHLIPLATLENSDVPRLREIPESDRPVISIPIATLGVEIHAPTAAVLYQLREVAVRGRSTRVDHFEQPVFAWK